jgi:hypothetical protein
MKERPVLFSAPMVRALLDGRKTQTRRIVKPQPSVGIAEIEEMPATDPHLGCVVSGHSGMWEDVHSCDERWTCPFGVPGDRLWVREEHTVLGHGSVGPTLNVRYDVDKVESHVDVTAREYGLFRERKSKLGSGVRGRFMYRSLSRITLEITAVRVERLNSVSYDDALAEGLEPVGDVIPDHVVFWRNYQYQNANPRRGVTIEDRFHRVKGYSDPLASYRSLWDKINGDGSWALNPWVWVIEFRRVMP